MTAAIPSSRAVTAAWETSSPLAVTNAPACTSNVFHDGLVADVMITSPGSNVLIAIVGSSTTSARPV